MLAKRDPQRSLFDPPVLAQKLVAPESFCARMGTTWSRESRRGPGGDARSNAGQAERVACDPARCADP